MLLPLQTSERNQNRTVTEAVSNTDLPGANTSPDTGPPLPDVPLPDEDTLRERVREQATREVERTYSLLFEHLGLTAQEKDALLSLLIKIREERTSSIFRGRVVLSGRTVDEDERSNRIAAVIGDPKLQQFLALERNLPSYRELGEIGSLLQQNGASLTHTQRDGLFKILVEVRDLYRTKLPAGIELNSIEAIEHQVAQRSEFERHVMELAPSVLALNQVVYLDEQYQYLSYQRADDLERGREGRADDPHFPLTFPVWN
ncbi:MAG TPA: hypothetical protein VJA26_18075 [Gammaproteobacteria bacterium]|nr:hypothetical protein [Gammaproteobacteria bacterium]